MKIAELQEGYFKGIDTDRQETGRYILEMGFDGMRFWGVTNAKSRKDAVNKLRYRLERQLRADYPQHHYNLNLYKGMLRNITDLRSPENKARGSIEIR